MMHAKLGFKRVLLVNPLHLNQGGYTPSPLALLYLAGYLRQDNRIKIKIVDGSKNGKEPVVEALTKFKPDLVGIKFKLVSVLINDAKSLFSSNPIIFFIEFSESLKDSLEKEGETVEYYSYSGGDHNLSSPNFEVAMQRSIEFFDRYLKGGDE
jgi:hypothetical protein